MKKRYAASVRGELRIDIDQRLRVKSVSAGEETGIPGPGALTRQMFESVDGAGHVNQPVWRARSAARQRRHEGVLPDEWQLRVLRSIRDVDPPESPLCRYDDVPAVWRPGWLHGVEFALYQLARLRKGPDAP